MMTKKKDDCTLDDMDKWDEKCKEIWEDILIKDFNKHIAPAIRSLDGNYLDADQFNVIKV